MRTIRSIPILLGVVLAAGSAAEPVHAQPGGFGFPGARGPVPSTSAGEPVLLGPEGIRFANEGVVVGWNFLEALVRMSTGPDAASSALPQYFDPNHPHAAWDPNDPSTSAFQGKCSLAQPTFCAFVQALFGIQPPPAAPPGDVRGGGNRSFGRRDFLWHDAPAPTPVGCLPARQGLSRLSAVRTSSGQRGRCPRR